MTNIVNNSYLTLKKNKKNYKLVLNDEKIGRNYIEFIKEKLNAKKEKKSLSFNANNISTLKTFIKKIHVSYDFCELLFLDMARNIEIIEKDGYGFLFFNMDDIIVVELKKTTYFFIMDFTNMFEIKQNELIVTRPFDKKNKLLSPQLKKQKKFPFSILNKDCYYSLALLIILVLNNSSKINTNDVTQHLESIKETKLYWALMRCLEDEVENRYMLLI